MVSKSLVVGKQSRDGKRVLQYRQVVGQFSNPNPVVAAASLDWLCDTCHNYIFPSITSSASPAGALPRVAAEDTYRRGGRLLELHCGFGHSTVALAPFFSSVVAVELNRRLAAAAEYNLTANNIQNVRVLRSATADFAADLFSGKTIGQLQLVKAQKTIIANRTSAEVGKFEGSSTTTSAWGSAAWLVEAMLSVPALCAGWARPGPITAEASGRISKRSSATQQELEQEQEQQEEGEEEEEEVEERQEEEEQEEQEVRMQPQQDVILLDPPRAGLDAKTLQLARCFHHVLYISCNPVALERNLQGTVCLGLCFFLPQRSPL